MQCPVDDINMDILPEYLLLDPCFQQVPGYTEIPQVIVPGEPLKQGIMIFLHIMEEEGVGLFHILHGDTHDPEEGLHGVIGMFDNFMSLFGSDLLVIVDHLKQQGIFILEMLIDGSFRHAHLLCQVVHGHASDPETGEQHP